jgi:PAS domain S-box-containing protein
MTEMHSLLKYQLKKYMGATFSVPKKWKEFLNEVNQTYFSAGVGWDKEEEERIKMKSWLDRQRDLVVALCSVSDLKEALGMILDEALKLEGIDSGGIYLVNKKTGGLDLIVHKGLSAEFIQQAFHYDADSPRTKLVKAGEAVYTGYKELCDKILADIDLNGGKEGLRAMAVLPVRYGGRVVACINLASHSLDDIPIATRSSLETFSMLVGGAISRIEMGHALQDSESRYRMLFENARDALIVADADTGIILEVNKETERLLNRNRTEIVGMHQTRLHPPEEREKYEKIFQTHVESGGYPAIEAEVITGDGRRIPVEITAVTMQMDDGRKVIRGSFRDISERKKIERELRQAKAVLEEWGLKLAERVKRHTEGMELSREKISRQQKLAMIGQMAASISRELKTPATVIKNSIYFLKKQGVEKKCPEAANHLAVLEKQVDSCVQIIDNILDFVKPREAVRHPVQIDKILSESIAKVEIPSNIKLEIKIEKNIPVSKVDPVQIGQVFVNLIKNAVWSMPRGGNLKIEASRQKSGLVIEFADTGIGIPAENMDLIFDPLFSTKPHGTGLGLTLCRQILDVHNGEIAVKSKPGRGSTFIVKLPFE